MKAGDCPPLNMNATHNYLLGHSLMGHGGTYTVKSDTLKLVDISGWQCPPCNSVVDSELCILILTVYDGIPYSS